MRASCRLFPFLARERFGQGEDLRGVGRTGFCGVGEGCMFCAASGAYCIHVRLRTIVGRHRMSLSETTALEDRKSISSMDVSISLCFWCVFVKTK